MGENSQIELFYCDIEVLLQLGLSEYSQQGRLAFIVLTGR